MVVANWISVSTILPFPTMADRPPSVDVFRVSPLQLQNLSGDVVAALIEIAQKKFLADSAHGVGRSAHLNSLSLAGHRVDRGKAIVQEGLGLKSLSVQRNWDKYKLELA